MVWFAASSSCRSVLPSWSQSCKAIRATCGRSVALPRASDRASVDWYNAASPKGDEMSETVIDTLCSLCRDEVVVVNEE